MRDPRRHRPAHSSGRNLREGERYIVALPEPARTEPARSSPPGGPSSSTATASSGLDSSSSRRRGHMESIFRSLRKAGIDRHDLYLAWDFTVASGKSLSRRLALDPRPRVRGARRPQPARPEGAGRVAAVHGRPGDRAHAGAEPNVTRRVEGTVTVPLLPEGSPAAHRVRATDLGADGLPRRIAGNTYEAALRVQHPRSASPGKPARPSLYGHGLFGDAGEAGAATWRSSATRTTCSSAPPTGSECRTRTCRTRSRSSRICRASPPGGPPPAGLPRLHVHRPDDDPPTGLRVTPAFQARGRPLIDTRRSSTTATARAGSRAGRSPRSPPTSTARCSTWGR